MNFKPTDRSNQLLKALNETLHKETKATPTTGEEVAVAILALLVQGTLQVTNHDESLAKQAAVVFTEAYVEGLAGYFKATGPSRN